MVALDCPFQCFNMFQPYHIYTYHMKWFVNYSIVYFVATWMDEYNITMDTL